MNIMPETSIDALAAMIRRSITDPQNPAPSAPGVFFWAIEAAGATLTVLPPSVQSVDNLHLWVDDVAAQVQAEKAGATHVRYLPITDDVEREKRRRDLAAILDPYASGR